MTIGRGGPLAGRGERGGCTIILTKTENPERQKLGVKTVAEGERHRGRGHQNQRIHDLSAPSGALPETIPMPLLFTDCATCPNIGDCHDYFRWLGEYPRVMPVEGIFHYPQPFETL